jgi:tripartite-type tricarboxylate transporter receptor subunit TctC
MTTPRGLFALLTGSFVLAISSLTAAAQNWPIRAVHFIVPFPAGGSTDVAARLVAEYLSRSLGTQIVVENKSGANGNLGVEAVAKSAPDGYTVLIATDSVSSNPHVYKVNIDPLKDLTPIIQLSRQPIVLAAHPSLGVNTLAELTAMARQQPGLRFATGSGLGSLQGMVGLWYAQIAGITMEQVPYRGGGQAINDLIAGHIKLGSLGSTPLVPHYKAGTLKLLAQSMQTRSPTLPDVPTYQEAGITGLAVDQWVGVFVPAGVPPAIAARLNAEIAKALRDEKISRSLVEQAQDPVGGSAEQFANLVREDYHQYARLVKQLNIKVN